MTITDLGHEEPTILITNNFKSSPAKLITRYAQRMIIENAIAEAIHFFHLRVDEQHVVVTSDKRAHNPFLVASGLADEPTPMPWFGNKTLIIRFA